MNIKACYRIETALYSMGHVSFEEALIASISDKKMFLRTIELSGINHAAKTCLQQNENC